MALASPLRWLKRRFSRDPATGDLHRLLNGYQTTALLYVAAKLNLPDLLSQSPRTTAELARAQNVHAPSLGRVLRGLTLLGICSQDKEGRFHLTPLGARLRSETGGSEYNLAILNGEEYAPAWNHLLHSVRTGEAAFDHAFGQSPWEHRRSSPALNECFNAWLNRGAVNAASSLLAARDFSQCRCVADVGGGNGALLFTLLQRLPNARGILFDQPHVLAAARAAVQTNGLASRCELVAGDFFEHVPPDADVYILKSVLHDWNDEQCLAILRRCHAALKPRQSLLVVEKILPAPASLAPNVVWSDLQMMAVTGGKERTEGEYRGLFERSGMALIKATALPTGHHLLETIPG